MDWLRLPKSAQFRPPLLSRRNFLRATASAIAGAAATGVYAVGVEPHWIEVCEVRMPLRRLPPQWIGRRIAQISDLHIGPRVSDEYLCAALQQVERLSPDVLLITGDFQTAWRAEQVDHVWRVMRNLRPPAGGCYAVLGNHDYGHGWSQVETADLLTSRLNDLGIHVLRNEHRVLNGLSILGTDELWSPNYDGAAALAGRPAGLPTIAMCHNPDGVDGREWEGFEGWVLSGHTHGGQCRPPFLSAPILPVVNRRYVAGEYDVGRGRTLYVNRGLGHSLRIRFNVRPEITLFTLAAA